MSNGNIPTTPAVVPGQTPGTTPPFQPDANMTAQRILQAIAINQSRKQFGGMPIPAALPQGGDWSGAHNIGMQTGNPNAWGAERFMSGLGAFIRDAVRAKKERQLQSAEGDWTTMQAYMNELYAAQASGDQQGAAAAQKKLDNFFMDDKKLKNMAKALNQDWLNPEKTTVHGEAMKNVAAQGQQKQNAMTGMKNVFRRLIGQNQQMKVQLTEQQRRQMAQEIEAKAPVMPGQLDDKFLLDIANQMRQQQQHEETLAERREFHEESLAQRKETAQQNFALRQQGLDQQKMALQARLDEGNLNRQQRADFHKDMMANQEANRALRKEIADMRTQAGEDARSEWADHVRRTGKITDVPTKERAGVMKYMGDNSMNVPTPIGIAEQKTIDEALETGAKVDGWLEQLDKLRDPKTGKLPNRRFSMFAPMFQYFTGKASPEAALISDFSRERWQAIAPLLHGIRRGDIIKDIVRHTPDPRFDSIENMYIKLQQLQKNYEQSRQAVLRGHHFDIDPSTGDMLPGELDKRQRSQEEEDKDWKDVQSMGAVGPGAAGLDIKPKQ